MDQGRRTGGGGKEVVLVTGGAGFVGQHIVRELQERDDDVGEIRVFDVTPYVNKLGSISTLSTNGGINCYFLFPSCSMGVTSLVSHHVGFIQICPQMLTSGPQRHAACCRVSHF